MINLLCEARKTDGMVDLFAQFLEGSLDSAQLHLFLALQESIDSVAFGVDYPSPDPEYHIPSDWVCTTRAGLVAREYCRVLRYDSVTRTSAVEP